MNISYTQNGVVTNVLAESMTAEAALVVKTPISTNTTSFQSGSGPEPALLKTFGGTSMRVGLYFNSFAFTGDQTVWPTPGSTDDAYTKRWLDAAIAEGIKPVLLMSMHSNSPTQDLDNNVPMDKLIAILLGPTMYKGKIDLELTNEPDVGAGPYFDPVQLANYYIHHYPKIKALDPTCRVMGAAFDGWTGISFGTAADPTWGKPGLSYIDAFMNVAGAPNSIDLIAVHCYYQMRAEYRFLSTQALGKKYPAKDLCITETGWSLARTQTIQPNEAQAGCDNDQQRHANRTCVDILMHSCIPRMRYSQIYKLRANGGISDPFWIFTSQGADTPTSLGLKDICPELRDSTKRRLYQVGTTGDILRDTMVVAIDAPNGAQKLVVWSDKGRTSLPLWVKGTSLVTKKLSVSPAVAVAIADGQALIDVPITDQPTVLSNATFPEYS